MNSIKNNGNIIKDIMVLAAMIALSYVASSLTGLTLSVPVLYLYVSAGLSMMISAIFFMVAANKINRHGILLVWAIVNGLTYLLMAYGFMFPYFVVLGIICELTMIGKDTYKKPIRTTIGWSVYGVGMMLGNAYPVWMAWDEFLASAPADGFSDKLLEMEYQLYTEPMLLVLGCVITVVLTVFGSVIANNILKRHFKKSGTV